ncbi:hypothetical protein SJDPG11_07150 [Porphyromonas gingivalis SJD11]|nr:hypothetical protein SJDPG11_07150 [Porphyromonas gingivalis SJD11]
MDKAMLSFSLTAVVSALFLQPTAPKAKRAEAIIAIVFFIWSFPYVFYR